MRVSENACELAIRTITVPGEAVVPAAVMHQPGRILAMSVLAGHDAAMAEAAIMAPRASRIVFERVTPIRFLISVVITPASPQPDFPKPLPQ